MKVTFTKVQDAQPKGEYQPTAVDAAKAAASFRLVNVSPNIIVWNDGRQQTVNARELKKLQAAHTWATDF